MGSVAFRREIFLKEFGHCHVNWILLFHSKTSTWIIMGTAVTEPHLCKRLLPFVHTAELGKHCLGLPKKTIADATCVNSLSVRRQSIPHPAITNAAKCFHLFFTMFTNIFLKSNWRRKLETGTASHVVDHFVSPWTRVYKYGLQ